ncbi:MAG TPA: phosphodiester glycosidase family protein [Phycisphaerae bacterium]|nr:phosphodiester glycosidase family protein [Phycisphaerales bacterium]HRX86043.1 phosphodiester glycosidase family protein [Phycisphaerae bacterium]
MKPFPIRAALAALALGAILVTPARAEVIVDNDAGAPAYVESGSWTTSGAAGYNGGTYRFANDGEASTATWSATLTAAGDLEVFVWYVPGSNRTTSTHYIVNAADGPHDVYLNQQAGGLTWESLGTFTFNAGAASVVVDAAASTGGSVVIADAVRFGDDGGGPIDPPDPVEIAPGVYHAEWDLPTPQVNHVVAFDLADPQYTIEMGFAQGHRYFTAKEPVSTIASRYDTAGHEVVAAINASFFGSGLDILGMLGSGGNLIASPTNMPHTYMLEQSGEGWAATNLASAAMVARFADDAEVTIDSLDYPCASGVINLYTPDYGPSTHSVAQGVEIIVENVNMPLRPNKWLEGRIAAIRTGSQSLDNAIPTDGFILAACSGAESELLAHATVGADVAVRFTMANRLVNLQTLVSGNYWIVKDGVAQPGEAVRHPRTVIAWSGTKHWFVTFDGRQAGYAVGATTAEQADFLINALGVENAINLDGGGSTTMVIDGTVVNCPSDNATTPCTGTERADPNALLLIRRTATSTFPLTDNFAAGNRYLPWDDKFGPNAVEAFVPTAPNGDGTVMHVLSADSAFETASVGKAGDANYVVEASVYCAYRPELAADGFERVGIFARDDGNANFDATTLGKGNCYALTFDSADGRVRAGKIVEGVFTDFLAKPRYETSTAWRRMRIDCVGTTIRYYLDGALIASASDTSRAHGRCGAGWHEYFATDANAQGAYVENFVVRGILFDTDGDGDVDLVDFVKFANCLRGPGLIWHPASFCRRLDGDGDGDVDFNDYLRLQEAYTGPL